MSSILKNTILFLYKYWKLQDDIYARSKETDDLNFLSTNCKGNEIHLLISDCCVNLNIFHYSPAINTSALVPSYILGPYDNTFNTFSQFKCHMQTSLYTPSFGNFLLRPGKRSFWLADGRKRFFATFCTNSPAAEVLPKPPYRSQTSHNISVRSNPFILMNV